MIKIAIASDKNKVSQHFGHCETFEIFEIEKNNIKKHESIKNPGHKPGFLPVFLKERNVDLVISQGMGQGAVDIFKENKIDVILGASGNFEDVAKEYLLGNLKSKGSICNNHIHEDECN